MKQEKRKYRQRIHLIWLRWQFNPHQRNRKDWRCSSFDETKVLRTMGLQTMTWVHFPLEFHNHKNVIYILSNFSFLFKRFKYEILFAYRDIFILFQNNKKPFNIIFGLFGTHTPEYQFPVSFRIARILWR